MDAADVDVRQHNPPIVGPRDAEEPSPKLARKDRNTPGHVGRLNALRRLRTRKS